jgi:PleD family two-component response regulator
LSRVRLPAPAGSIAVSVSIGITDLARSGATTPTALYASADRMLYEAKDLGRNRAALAPAAVANEHAGSRDSLVGSSP